jgi:thymidine kinase
MSKLSFKYGAMNSGKSDLLIKTAYNYTEQGLQIATIKPSIDTKGDRFIVARGGARREVDILADPDMNVREEVKLFMAQVALEKLHCVLVDEAQFLQPKQVEDLFEIAKVDNTSVIAHGLRTDFQTNLFPGSRRLLELADVIEKIPTMCSCGSQAEFNCRKQNGQYVFSGDQVAIDGEGETTYESLCGECYMTERASRA